MGSTGQTEWSLRDQFGRECRVQLVPAGEHGALRGVGRTVQAVRSLVFFASSAGPLDPLGRALVAIHDALTGRALAAPHDAAQTAAYWREVEDALVGGARLGTLRVDVADLSLGYTMGVASPPPPPAPKPAPAPVEGTTWFSLRVLDEVGDPLDGLKVTYSVGGERKVVTTNGAGIARVDGVTAGFASAALDSLDAVREKLRPRWKKPRDPKRIDDPNTTSREIGAEVTEPVSLSSELPATLVITPYFRCREIPGAHFAFGRSFVLGAALDNLAGIAEELSADDGRKGMIFGHTDLAGPEDLNKELSERRAKAIFALFTHDAAAWEELYTGTADGAHWKEKWDVEEAQHMLNALGVTDDAGHAIPENGVRNASTKQAIHRFQAGDYPDKPAEQAPLAKADFLGKDGRKELFLAYAKRVTRKPVDKAKFEKFGSASFMGCGEFNPLSLTVKDAESRRAVCFVFDAAAGPKALPCALRSLGPCKANTGPMPTTADPENPPYRCKIYQEVAKKCPCQGGADLSHDLILRFPIKLKEADALPHTYELESDDGTITRTRKLASDGRANAKERVELYFEHLPLVHAYKVTCKDDGEPYELFEFEKLPELQRRAKLAEHEDVGDSGALNDFWVANKDAPPEDTSGEGGTT